MLNDDEKKHTAGFTSTTPYYNDILLIFKAVIQSMNDVILVSTSHVTRPTPRGTRNAGRWITARVISRGTRGNAVPLLKSCWNALKRAFLL